MTAQFPDDIYAQRDIENVPGVVFDDTKTTRIFAEDLVGLGDEVTAIETALGENPQGAYDTVKAWLTALASSISSLVVSFLDLSDSPSSYSGQGGKIVKVKVDESGLEFGTGGGGAVDSVNGQTGVVVLDYTDVGAEAALGFTPENVANKQTDLTASATKYPTVNAVNTGLATKENSLGFTAENVANKQTDLTASATKYPTVNAVNTGLATKQNSLGYTAEDSANKDTDSTFAANSNTKYPSQKAVKTAFVPTTKFLAEVRKFFRNLFVYSGWKSILMPGSVTWSAVCWSPELGIYCAVGFGGTNRVATSPDGVTWTAQAEAESNSWMDICWAPALSLFVAISIDGTHRVMTSSNGTSWAAQTAAEANAWRSIVWSPDLALFVAVAGDGTHRVMTSSNGTAWSTQTAAQLNTWFGVCWSPELALFVAVAQDGTNRVMTSSNGTSWATKNAAAANQWRKVCWSPELGIFVAVAQDGTNRVMTSPDGTTWTGHPFATVAGAGNVCWCPEISLFIAVTFDGTYDIMTSVDGVTWLAQSETATNSWSGVCWSPELSQAVAIAFDGTNRVMVSNHGLTANNVTTARNGLVPKPPNDSQQLLDGTGVFSAGTGTQYLFKAGDSSTSSTSFSDIPELNAFVVKGPGTYHFYAHLMVQTNATTVGILCAGKYTSGSGSIQYLHKYPTSATAFTMEYVTSADSGTLPLNGPGTTNTEYILAGVLTVISDGVFTLRFKSETATATTVKGGSYCRLTRLT